MMLDSILYAVRIFSHIYYTERDQEYRYISSLVLLQNAYLVQVCDRRAEKSKKRRKKREEEREARGGRVD